MMSLTRETILKTVWRFERSDQTLLAIVRFMADGSLNGATSGNEHRWEFSDGRLLILGESGSVTTRFGAATIVGGRWVLRGDFLPLGLHDHHWLHEGENTQDWDAVRRTVPEILSVFPEAVLFQTTARVIDALVELGVYFGRSLNRFDAGDVLFVPRFGQTEPYCSFSVGNRIVSMGAFSYSESPLPDMQIGRYCSIASGLDVFRDRHPIEWATSSSVSYDFVPPVGYQAFAAAQNRFNRGLMLPRRPDDLLGPPPILEHDIWIGQNVQLARGIRIGTGSVVAAGAVVTRDVEPYSIMGGVPARRIRQRFPDRIVERLLAVRWWVHGPDLLHAADVTDLERFLETAEAWNDRPAFEPRFVRVDDLLEQLER